MNAQDEKQDTFESAAYNPFPEPQTIPSGWDTSIFLSSPQLSSPEQVDELAERESN